MDQKLRKMEDRLHGVEPTDEEKLAFRKAEKELRAQKKKERKELRTAAKQSLDVGHWTKEILNGTSGSKFAATQEATIEDKLSKDSVGLVTYEALKAKKEALEAEQARAAEDAKRKADEDARDRKELKKVKVEKVKSKLSFNPDLDD